MRAESFSAQLVDNGVTYYFMVRTVDLSGLDSVDSNEIALTSN